MLAGDRAGYWRRRIGGYRVVVRLEDEWITVLAVRVAHRRGVDRRVNVFSELLPQFVIGSDPLRQTLDDHQIGSSSIYYCRL
jgi:hypothetical protein